MRRILLKSAIVFACLIAWAAGARPLSMLLDRLHTVQIDSERIEELGIADVSGGMLRINHLPMSIAGPDSKPYPIEMKVDATRQFVVESGGRSIVLGRIDGSLGRAGGPVLKPDFG